MIAIDRHTHIREEALRISSHFRLADGYCGEAVFVNRVSV